MLSESIDLLPKPHNAPVLCPTMYISIYNQCVHNYVVKSCISGYFSDALWNLWDKSMNSYFHFLAAFTEKKSRKIASHIGLIKGPDW